ncbi:hypothetical protein G3164_004847 [Salmonella enterica subsp. enterica serovar Montevideo]|nr:hypothetical protein [Salmonella enterica subsp. enterica serovar Montevideo]
MSVMTTNETPASTVTEPEVFRRTRNRFNQWLASAGIVPEIPSPHLKTVSFVSSAFAAEFATVCDLQT